MRLAVISLCLCLTGAPAAALEIEEARRFGPEDAVTTLEILSTADIAFFAPKIDAFLATRPALAVAYTVVSSADLMDELETGSGAFDLAISSAMDLQIKFANDGGARAHRSDVTASLPDWAAWNDEVFAFTQEPAAIVVSNAAFAGSDIPRSRQDLIATLRENPDRFRGRVGTYDVRRSGLGYLFATQDARASETYWRLTEVLGGLDARLYCCSSDMIDAVVSGELAVAYNVLASYALTRTDRDAFTVVLPSDFTTLMLRSVLIPDRAPHPDIAGAFIDHLLADSFEGSVLRPVEPAPGEGALRRIDLGPALLVYLDRFKRRGFVAEWESAILQ